MSYKPEMQSRKLALSLPEDMHTRIVSCSWSYARHSLIENSREQIWTVNLLVLTSHAFHLFPKVLVVPFQEEASECPVNTALSQADQSRV